MSHFRRPSRRAVTTGTVAWLAGGVIVGLLGLVASTPTGAVENWKPLVAGALTPDSPKITFYASMDNDPPFSTTIAYPRLHQKAGGTGTYADPITFAADARLYPTGTRIYVPRFRKYFVMEDRCAGAVDAYPAALIDLYAGTTDDARILDLEDALTPDGPINVVVGPQKNYVVDTHPFWRNGTGYTTTYSDVPVVRRQ
jgi:3D (Asp-Asp-Asp) domain-containing protein